MVHIGFLVFFQKEQPHKHEDINLAKTHIMLVSQTCLTLVTTQNSMTSAACFKLSIYRIRAMRSILIENNTCA